MPLHSGWASALWLPAAGVLTAAALLAHGAFEAVRRCRLHLYCRRERRTSNERNPS